MRLAAAAGSSSFLFAAVLVAFVRLSAATQRPRRRVAAMGEALSDGFCVALVQTVPQHPLTIPHDLSRPPHGQRRPDRSPKRPDRFSRPPLWRFWRRQRRPRWPGRSGPSTAVSSISRAFRAFRAFKARPRLLYRPQRWRHDTTRATACVLRRFRANSPSIFTNPCLARAASCMLWMNV
jgi:hypothetical protein